MTEIVRQADRENFFSAARRPLPNRSRRFFIFAVTLLIAFGSIVRIRQYLAKTSFWRDEAFVVLNVRQLTARQLIGKLNWDQAAPPFFLWALKGMRSVAGENELSLRLVSVVCSLGALVVYAIVAVRSLPMPAAFLSIGLLCFGRRLIEYSAQVKQYSGDVLVSALILLIGVSQTDLPPQRRLARTAIFSAIAIWFSHTTAIVFGGVSLLLTLKSFRRGRMATLWALMWNALFALSLAMLYFVSIRKQHTPFLYDYWRDSLADWRHPGSIPMWLWRQGYDFLQTPYRWAGSLFAILLLLSLPWMIWRRRSETLTASLATLALLIVAAMADQYPLDGGRLTLFAMPQLFLLCGAGAALIWETLPVRWRPVWWLLPVALLGSGVALGAERLIHPQFQSHIRPAVAYVKVHRQPGEALVLAGVPSKTGSNHSGLNGRDLEALCYWPDPPPPVYLSLSSPDQIRQRSFWVLAAFGPDNLKDLQPVLARFRSVAVEQDDFIVKQGGCAYLFERAEKN